MATTFTIKTPDGSDLTEDIRRFAEAIGLDRAAPRRYSLLLALCLYAGLKSGQLDPARVVREIEALEGVGPPSQLKPPIQHKHPPLKGLWHKHYQTTDLSSMALNLRTALRAYGLPSFEAKAAQAERSGDVQYIAEGDVRLIVQDAVVGNFLRRAQDAALTGEWIVYAQHRRRNYYLALATHAQQTHQDIRTQIDAISCREFPFLAGLLATA